MRIINLLSRFLVLTKKIVFKNFLTKILFYLFVMLQFSSFNFPFDDYHNQQFELFYEDENVIIWHSRNLEIKDPSIAEYKIYDRYWNKINKTKIDHKMDSIIGWRTHSNYKESLEKYSSIILYY